MEIIIKENTIFAFADTHGNHRKLSIPKDVDIIICAGDAVEDNLKGGEYDDFIKWFAGLPSKWKIFIPGNHELSFERGREEVIINEMTTRGITVLQDAIEECNGVIVGSLSNGSVIADKDIPKDLDILVTHRPPYGILDEGLGSLEILNFVLKAQPKYHLFGHIHATAGQEFQLGNTRCCNVAMKIQI